MNTEFKNQIRTSIKVNALPDAIMPFFFEKEKADLWMQTYSTTVELIEGTWGTLGAKMRASFYTPLGIVINQELVELTKERAILKTSGFFEGEEHFILDRKENFTIIYDFFFYNYRGSKWLEPIWFLFGIHFGKKDMENHLLLIKKAVEQNK